MTPVLLKKVEGEIPLVVKSKAGAMPPPVQTVDRYQLSGEIPRGGIVQGGGDIAYLDPVAAAPTWAMRFKKNQHG